MSILGKMQVLTDSAQYDLCDYVNHNKSSQVVHKSIYLVFTMLLVQMDVKYLFSKHYKQINVKMTVNTVLTNLKDILQG